MVEFALVLPLLALLLVMAIDFGRVFFGWIAIQNAARVGADVAAQRASAWPTGDNNSDEDAWVLDYQALISEDLQPLNCTHPTPHPDPTFDDADIPVNNNDHDWGDLVTVRLTCEFDLLTPLAESIVGGPIAITAESTFAIHGTVVAGIPDAPPLPCEAPVATWETTPAINPGPNRINLSTATGLTITFTDTTLDTVACPVTGRLWTFEDDGSTENTVDVVVHDFPPHAGGGFDEYEVTLTVTTAEGTDTIDVNVRVSS